MAEDINYRIARKMHQLRTLGLGNILAYYQSRKRASAGGEVFSIPTPLCTYPVYCRPGTSDIHVFAQVLFDEQYLCLDFLKGVKRILDCGANVGYTAAYLLTKHPEATLVAIEPDPETAKMLRKNTGGYGDRVQVIEAGIWHRDAGLKIVPSPIGAWANQVHECEPGETPQVTAVGIGSLMDRLGWDWVDLLKIDIEGAEVNVFRNDTSAWIKRVGTIAIELHNEEAREAFFNTVKPFSPVLEEHGELTVCRFPVAN